MMGAAKPPRPALARFPVLVRQTAAVACETLLQSRGIGLWVVLAAGSAAGLAAGLRLPGSAGVEVEPGASELAAAGGLGPLLLYASLSVLAVIAALASGSRALPADRRAGIKDLLGCRPLFASAYFLGRFIGLAARFTAAAVLIAAAGGMALAMLEPGSSLSRVVEPVRFSVGGVEQSPDAPVLIPPNGSPASWLFAGLDQDSAPSAVRFALRVKMPASGPMQAAVPVGVRVLSGGKTVVEENLVLGLRRELTIALPDQAFSAPGVDPAAQSKAGMEVQLAVRGGHNLIETGFRGCVAVAGKVHPAPALAAAILSILPVIWAALALGLCFGAVVSEPAAMLGTGVLVLVVLSGPSLERDFRLLASGAAPAAARHHAVAPAPAAGAETAPPEGAPGSPRFLLSEAASAAAWLCGLLPDPRAGGGARPLGRGECPALQDVVMPWREGAPHLIAILVIGGLVASWRRP